MQQLFAITILTWKAALRFRLFIVVAGLLLAAVVGLPILIKDDGTARGFTQILLTYTLSSITALLGISTLWWGTLLIYLAAILTLWSMAYYLMLAKPQIAKKTRE